MSLDITFTMRQNTVCPKCGEIIGHMDVDSAHSGGRAWYPFLEEIGYYVPYEQRTEENDWYGKDMVLTAEQTESAYKFVKKKELFEGYAVRMLIATAILEKATIVVNADW